MPKKKSSSKKPKSGSSPKPKPGRKFKILYGDASPSYPPETQNIRRKPAAKKKPRR
jgi:hypothetical protein